jgi:uncharacterized protein (DUF2235 family)
MKRLVVCCDGTWQTLIQKTPTNVALMAQAIAPRDDAGLQQIVHYDSGVGTSFTVNNQSWLSRLIGSAQRFEGGAFGGGLEEKIYDAYRFLAMNYSRGDQIFLFGFSRGAYTVRSLAGMIYCSGLLFRQNITLVGEAFALYRDPEIKPGDWAARLFRETHGNEPDIAFLGCWDTVGMRGVPSLSERIGISDQMNARYGFHDTQLNRRIRTARHACAIDERRKAFPVTAMDPSPNWEGQGEQVKSRWFIGPHGGIGGGEAAHQPLSEFALKWMAEAAMESGLKFFPEVLYGKRSSDPMTAIKAPTGAMNRLGFEDRKLTSGASIDDLDPSVIVRWKGDKTYRPGTLKPLEGKLKAAAAP